MTIRSLIVDDEPPARRRIHQLLATETDIEIVGECSNGPEAIAFIQEHRPDLVFLDVQMPEVTGFDVLRALSSDRLPAVIFTTAYDRHALEAFEVHAVDFLLKPIRQSRFQEAIQRVRELIQTREVAAANQRLLASLRGSERESPYLSRVAINTGGRTIFLKVEDVEYIESAANYVVLHAAGETYILRETLIHLESRLPPRSFLRISRSIIVNLAHIKELQPALGSEHYIVLENGKKLVLSRGLRELQDRLQHL